MDLEKLIHGQEFRPVTFKQGIMIIVAYSIFQSAVDVGSVRQDAWIQWCRSSRNRQNGNKGMWIFKRGNPANSHATEQQERNDSNKYWTPE